MKYQAFAGVLAAAAVALAGCGSDGSTSAPDTAPPLAPQIVNGYCKEAGKVVLTWSPNTESDLAGYNIYMEGRENPVGSVNMRQRSTALLLQPLGPAVYYLTAVDHSGNESAPSARYSVHVAEPPGPEINDFFELR